MTKQQYQTMYTAGMRKAALDLGLPIDKLMRAATKLYEYEVDHKSKNKLNTATIGAVNPLNDPTTNQQNDGTEDSNYFNFPASAGAVANTQNTL